MEENPEKPQLTPCNKKTETLWKKRYPGWFAEQFPDNALSELICAYGFDQHETELFYVRFRKNEEQRIIFWCYVTKPEFNPNKTTELNWHPCNFKINEWETDYDLRDAVLIPGTYLKLTDGRIQLVGDCNKHMGQCNCCSHTDDEIAFYSHDYVELYNSIISTNVTTGNS